MRLASFFSGLRPDFCGNAGPQLLCTAHLSRAVLSLTSSYRERVVESVFPPFHVDVDGRQEVRSKFDTSGPKIGARDVIRQTEPRKCFRAMSRVQPQTMRLVWISTSRLAVQLRFLHHFL